MGLCLRVEYEWMSYEDSSQLNTLCQLLTNLALLHFIALNLTFREKIICTSEIEPAE